MPGTTAKAVSAGPTHVLDRVEVRCGLGPRYALPLLADLIAVWVRHLPLLEGEGNWGQIDGDPPADARYTRLALSAVGKLALAAEREQVGPVPLAIIEAGLFTAVVPCRRSTLRRSSRSSWMSRAATACRPCRPGLCPGTWIGCYAEKRFDFN